MEGIGEYLLLTHQQGNSKAIALDGIHWALLSSTTQALKPRHQTAPLRLNDILLNQFIYQADNSGLEFGSNMIYAVMQHFGGTTSPKSMIPNKAIPAREFIGTSLEDENVILDILQNYIVS
jgi:phage gpG-like protein